MRLQCLFPLVLVGALGLTTPVLAQTTLAKVTTRGTLVCGVNTGSLVLLPAGLTACGMALMWTTAVP